MADETNMKEAEAVRKSEGKAKDPRKKKKRRKVLKRLIILLVLLAILAGAGWIAYNRLRAEYKITYDAYTATVGTISNSLSYTGTMQLIHNSTYTAASSAKVREVYVAVGDRVSEGDKLIRLSTGETYTADFDGTVNKVDVEKGDEVNPNTSLVQIADFDHMRVSFRVGESDISDVSVGQACRVTVSSISATFEANISTIDYASYSGNNVAYYTATVDVDTSSVDNIYPGMQASITIPQQEASNVVILKMDAISTARDNTAYVFKQAEDGTMTQEAITVGVSNGNYVEITSGVSEGETVYAIAQTDDTEAGLFASIFGSQQVNMPSGGGFGGGSFGGGDMPSGFGGGSGSAPDRTNRDGGGERQRGN